MTINLKFLIKLKANFGDKIDAAFENEGGVVATSSSVGRVIYSPTGPMNKDYSDIRSFAESAEKGIKR